jgi:spermidine synthase
LFISGKFENYYLREYYKEPILEVHQSEYQDIVLTKRGEDFRMYLNGNIQFLSLDEARYHEALVDWPMKLLEDNDQNKSVLIL